MFLKSQMLMLTVCACFLPILGSTLITVGEYQKRLGGAEREFLHTSAATFLTPLRNFLEGDWRTISVRLLYDWLSIFTHCFKSTFCSILTQQRRIVGPRTLALEVALFHLFHLLQNNSLELVPFFMPPKRDYGVGFAVLRYFICSVPALCRKRGGCWKTEGWILTSAKHA